MESIYLLEHNVQIVMKVQSNPTNHDLHDKALKSTIVGAKLQAFLKLSEISTSLNINFLKFKL